MLSTTSEPHQSLADDLVWGICGEDGIAAELNIPVAKAYYLVEKGVIPVRRLGRRTIVASRRQLRQLFAGEVE